MSTGRHGRRRPSAGTPSVLIFLAILEAFTLGVMLMAEATGTGALSTSFLKVLARTLCLALRDRDGPRLGLLWDPQPRALAFFGLGGYAIGMWLMYADRGGPALDHRRGRPGHRAAAGAGEMAIVLVEQYFDFAHRLARICILRRGSVVNGGGGGRPLARGRAGGGAGGGLGLGSAAAGGSAAGLDGVAGAVAPLFEMDVTDHESDLIEVRERGATIVAAANRRATGKDVDGAEQPWGVASRPGSSGARRTGRAS